MKLKSLLLSAALVASALMLAAAFMIPGEIAGAFFLGASHLFLAGAVVLYSYSLFARASDKAREEMD